MARSVDLIGKNIDACLKAVRVHTDEIRKNMNLANEKSRSIGTLSEGLSEGVEKAAQLQQSAMRSSLIGFATILARIEFSRKSLYNRMATISQTAFLAPAKSSINYATALKKRDDALRRIVALPQGYSNDQQINQLKVAASSANSLAVQESRSWFGQYNAEIKKNLRDYAHAQMEFAAKALEQWSIFMEDLALLDFNRDTDEVVSLLEQGTSVQTGAIVPAAAETTTEAQQTQQGATGTKTATAGAGAAGTTPAAAAGAGQGSSANQSPDNRKSNK